MAFKVKPFREVLAMTKEKIDEALAPIRARAAKAKADSEICKLQEQLIDLESSIHKLCAEKELDFIKIADQMDQYDLKERRLKQIESIVSELFPAE